MRSLKLVIISNNSDIRKERLFWNSAEKSLFSVVAFRLTARCSDKYSVLSLCDADTSSSLLNICV